MKRSSSKIKREREKKIEKKVNEDVEIDREKNGEEGDGR